jgi:hypothetical protein
LPLAVAPINALGLQPHCNLPRVCRTDPGARRTRRNPEIEALILILVGLVCALPIGLQRRRLARLKRSWQELAARNEWLYIASRGPWYQRESARVMIPSAHGAIELVWQPGYRGSTATTQLRSLARGASDFSIHLQEKRNPERVYHCIETGDRDYDAIYQASSTDPDSLRRALDADFCRSHGAQRAEFECLDELLTLEVEGLIDDEQEITRLLSLDLALLDALSPGASSRDDC